MVLDSTLLNTQHYQVRIKGKVKEFRPLQHLGVVAIEKGAFGSLSITVANFTYNSFLFNKSHFLYTVIKFQPVKTDSQWICADTRYRQEELLRVMDGRDGWWEKVSKTWWWGGVRTREGVISLVWFLCLMAYQPL